MLKKEYSQPDFEIVIIKMEHSIALSGDGDNLQATMSTDLDW